MLAANANIPTLGSSGSGIYDGKNKTRNVIVKETPTTKVIKAKVQHSTVSTEYEFDFIDRTENFVYSLTSNQRKRAIEAKKKMFLKKENLSAYNIMFLDFGQNQSQIGELSHNGISCKYSIQVSDNGERASFVSNCCFHLLIRSLQLFFIG